MGNTTKGAGSDRRSPWARLKGAAAVFRRELDVWRRVLRDPRTPRRAKVLLAVAVGYALLPFDPIPDFIPVLGYLDDVLVIALLTAWAVRMVPPEVIADARAEAAGR